MKRVSQKQQLMEDLGWAYNRLDHMLTVYKYPNSVPGSFGFSESMQWIEGYLPKLRERYGFKEAWPNENAANKMSKPKVKNKKS